MLIKTTAMVNSLHGGHTHGKPGKVGEFDIGLGKVKVIVVCLWCATAVVIVKK